MDTSLSPEAKGFTRGRAQQRSVLGKYREAGPVVRETMIRVSHTVNGGINLEK